MYSFVKMYKILGYNFFFCNFLYPYIYLIKNIQIYQNKSTHRIEIMVFLLNLKCKRQLLNFKVNIF